MPIGQSYSLQTRHTALYGSISEMNAYLHRVYSHLDSNDVFVGVILEDSPTPPFIGGAYVSSALSRSYNVFYRLFQHRGSVAGSECPEDFGAKNSELLS